MGEVLSVAGAVLMAVLVIVLILLLLICFLLVCPACYKVRADYHEALTAGGRVLWLLGIVYVSFTYQDGNLDWHMRLFGLDIQKLLKRRAERGSRKKAGMSGKKQKKKAAASRQSSSERLYSDVKEQAEPQEKENPDAIMSQEEPEEEWPDAMFSEEEYEEEWPDVNMPEKKQKEEWSLKAQKEDFFEGEMPEEGIWRKLPFRRWKQGISGFIKSIRQFFHSLFSVVRKIRKKAEWMGEAKKFWQSENTRKMVCILKDNVLHLWRKLKPGVLRGNIVFGAGDPCLTGQILGAVAMVYASCGGGIQVTPDFEETRLEGNLLVKGRISLITILIVLIRIFLSGEWSQFKRETEQLKEAL